MVISKLLYQMINRHWSYIMSRFQQGLKIESLSPILITFQLVITNKFLIILKLLKCQTTDVILFLKTHFDLYETMFTVCKFARTLTFWNYVVLQYIYRRFTNSVVRINTCGPRTDLTSNRFVLVLWTSISALRFFVWGKSK